MKARSNLFACAFAILFAASPAAAQGMGQAGDLAIGAERLFGFYMGKQTYEAGGVQIDSDISTFSLLWDWNPSLLEQPRFAIDYFPIDGFSVGGTLGVFAAKREQNDATGILFQGRAGYHLNISRAVGFWPRGGLVYYTVNSDNLAGMNDVDQLALSLEAIFTLAPRDGWAFILGPTIDFGLTGGADPALGLPGGANAEVDFHEYALGLMMGMTGWVSL